MYDFGLLLTSASYYSGFMCQLQGVLIYFSGISCSIWTSCFSSILLMLVLSNTFSSIQSCYRYFFAVSVGRYIIYLILVVFSQSVLHSMTRHPTCTYIDWNWDEFYIPELFGVLCAARAARIRVLIRQCYLSDVSVQHLCFCCNMEENQ